jgi:hypothetical protein
LGPHMSFQEIRAAKRFGASFARLGHKPKPFWFVIREARWFLGMEPSL